MSRNFFICPVVALLSAAFLAGEETGTLEGRVTLETGGPVHDATVLLVQLGLVAETDRDGQYVLRDVPPGTYDVMAFVASVSSETHLVEVKAGATQVVDLQLRLSRLKHEVTVTASGEHQSTFDAVQSVVSLDAVTLSEKAAPSIGEALDGELGVSKRSFGTGSSRPVIRGFDGDRVLVMQDGVRVGSLGSSSGDHGEPIDASALERLEVVKGPATLLYGSNAIGGVVNAISGHFDVHRPPQQGTKGQVSGVAGSNNGQAGFTANIEHGRHSWLVWAGGGLQRTGDYETPLGQVENSKTRSNSGSVGFGWYGDRAFASLGYDFNDGRFGIPFAQELEAGVEGEEGEELEGIDIDSRRHHIQFGGGLNGLGFLDSFRLTLNQTYWEHDEVERLAGGEEEIGTSFDNQQFVYRGLFKQKQQGPLSGSFGFWGLVRDYDVHGAEALSPPIDQKAVALFALEEVEVDRFKVQFGARLEHNSYQPQGPGRRETEAGQELIELPDRDFTGLSAGAGIRVRLWSRGALVANFTTSYRSPALEELYNFGPHAGLLAFEIGDPELKRERSRGLDLSLRHRGSRASGEINFFHYSIDDFVFLSRTGRIREGLLEGEYRQGDSRFLGAEARLDLELRDFLWLTTSFNWVDARLSDLDLPLPRIPPLKVTLGLDFRYKGFSLEPELSVADRQDELFTLETPTPGYAVLNLKASYTRPQRHLVHHFSFSFFNAGDRLYRNHVSFIKELAPEIGRGVRFSYVMRFF